MRAGPAFAFCLTLAVVSSLKDAMATVEHVPCPCSSPEAFIQFSEDVDPSDLLEESMAASTNSTDDYKPDGSVDLTKTEDVAPGDSICVCKRIKRPTTPVRCTRPDLLHEDCNERDKIRQQGFQIAPENQLATLYPDEVDTPKPAVGKVFHDKDVESASPQPLSVETIPVTPKNAAMAGLALLSSKENKPEQKRTEAFAVEPAPQPVKKAPVNSAVSDVVPITKEAGPQPESAASRDYPEEEHVKRPYVPTVEANSEAGESVITESDKVIVGTPKAASEGPGIPAITAPVASEMPKTDVDAVPLEASAPAVQSQSKSTEELLAEQKKEIESLKLQLTILESQMGNLAAKEHHHQ